MNLPLLDPPSLPDAIDALDTALVAGFDPATDPARSIVPTPAGQILLMPSSIGPFAGVKLVTVAPSNASVGLPRIQGVYVLLDGATLSPLALLDGIALTAVRTPAVSAVAVRRLSPLFAGRLLVFGTGPQAYGHVLAMQVIRPISEVVVVGRSGVPSFVERVASLDIPARPGTPSDVARADIICCCTTAREPLFDSSLLAPHATVVAVGSHEPDTREVDTGLVHRATVVVEDRATALREAGDIVQGQPSELATLADLAQGRVPVDPDRPRLFKSTGMAWEDLVVAAASALPGATPA
jgi:ornithine cyclodeaminase